MLFIYSMKWSMRKLESGKSTASILLLIIGIMARFLVIGSLLYVSLRMNITFALSLVAGFTLAQIVLIINLSRKARHGKYETDKG